MYFTEETRNSNPQTPQKDGSYPVDTGDKSETVIDLVSSPLNMERTIRKQLMNSSPAEPCSPSKKRSVEKLMKTPSKPSPSKSSARKSVSKKSTSKKTPTISAKKRKLIADLESQVEGIEASIVKMKKEKTNLKGKMTRLAKVESDVKASREQLLPLPDPLLRLEDSLPEDSIHDAIAVWNFMNSFNKQLSITSISWDDFTDLIKFTHYPSQALIDLFSAPLKLILSDHIALTRLQALVPRKVHFSHRFQEIDSIAETTPASTLVQQGSTLLNNMEDYDNQYNGMKLLPKKFKAETIDSLRWSAILRCLFLRLEPIRQLRRAVAEAVTALQFHFETAVSNPSSIPVMDLPSRQFIDALHDLNRRYCNSFVQPIRLPATEEYEEPSLANKKSVTFQTPSTKNPSREDAPDLDHSSLPFSGLKSTGKRIELNAETMSKINTPKSKSRNKSSGLNKDAIFNITSHFLLNLQEYYQTAQLLEIKEVHELSPKQKLSILKVLCDACMDTERIQDLMERNAEERANQITHMNRLVKEQKMKMKEVSSGKRDAALEACRRLNREKATTSLSEGKRGRGDKKTGNKGGKTGKGSLEPTVEQLSAMIDDLIALEAYGIQTVREDPAFEDISDSEEEEEEDPGEGSASEDGDGSNEESGGRGRSRKQRKPASMRTRALSRQRSRAEKMERNGKIAYALERISSAMERNTERELRGAIKVAERAGFRGTDEKSGQVFVTESLKQAYRQLSELENKASDDKIASKHEKALEEFFVRTEPLGTDRYGRIYWRFMADENRLFVETREEDPETRDFGPSPPAVLSSEATTDQVVLNRLFQSRPNRYKYKWTVYSTPSELWKLCEALDDRGEREKELKAAIKARYEIEAPAVVYQTSGSEFLGRKVKRTFGRKTVHGAVVGWLPATEEDQALWHIVHLDGDEEDLDEEELREALLDDFSDNILPNKEVPESSKDVSLEENEKNSIADDMINAHDANSVKVDMEEGDDFNKDNAEDNESSTPHREEEAVFVPAIVKKSTGLGKANHHSRGNLVSGLFGVGGLSQECLRFVNSIAEGLKRKAEGRFSREDRKVLEQRLRVIDDFPEIKAIILELEDLIHSCQSREDRKEQEESALAKEEERKEMIKEGWIFDRNKCEFIGRKGRRYFPKFGVSDGVITAMLPEEKNEGVALYRMIHTDGDREDLDEEDLLFSLNLFDRNLSETDIKAELQERRASSNGEAEAFDDEDDDEDENEGDDDVLIDDSSQGSSFQYNEEGLLWPSLEVRQRWRDAVEASNTVGELALAVSTLEESTFDFGLFGDLDPVFPLTLFSPPLDPETAKLLAQTNRYPQRRRELAQHFHHEALSPRKAKKRAISEISRCQRESPVTIDDDSDDAPRRSRRVATSHLNSSHSSSSNLQFYNSGRPSRHAAQKAVNYAV